MTTFTTYTAQYFNEEEYLQNKTNALSTYDRATHWTVDLTRKAIADAGMTPWQHFTTFGAFERAANGGYGINPSENFDLDAYYHDKLEQCGIANFTELLSAFKDASLDPITHFSLYGINEGLSIKNELSSYINKYFNEEEYIQNKTDQLNGIEVYVNQKEASWTPELTRKAISDAGMTPWEHFHQYGAYETRYLSRDTDENGNAFYRVHFGIDPSSQFNIHEYYMHKATLEGISWNEWRYPVVEKYFKNINLDTITHYSVSGENEGLHVYLTENAKVSIEYPTVLPESSNPVYYSENERIPLTGDRTIDALLFTTVVNWNKYGAISNTNTLYYHYSEFMPNGYGSNFDDAVFSPFTSEQKENSKKALDYLSCITGIEFKEINNSEQANLLLFSADFNDGYTIGFSCIGPNQTRIPVTTNSKFKYNEAEGISVLLHELGHALGLKHPFTGFDNNQTVLTENEDLKSNTIMSYTNDIPYNLSYAPYDFAALNYLYGGDGLNGERGLVCLSGVQQNNYEV